MSDNVGQDLANIIAGEAHEAWVKHVIHSVNKARAKRADVIMACSIILGQSIAASDPDVADEMRHGIVALIDLCTIKAKETAS